VQVFIVTNDFPPRIGGINDYVDRLARRFPAGSVTIFTSSYRGHREHDAGYPHEVIRLGTEMMLPTPGVARELHALLRSRRPDVVLFGALWPLGHLGPAIERRLGIPYGGFSHGLELTGAIVPGVLRHIGARALLLTAVSDWARRRLESAFGWRGRMSLLPSGVDVERFHPGVADAGVRAEHALGDDPVVCCVSRLVPRKGQDTLIRAFPEVRAAVPRARLLVVGDGPYREALRAQAGRLGLASAVVFTGAVPYAVLPSYTRAGDVFAMPCRSRWLGFDVEALGAVLLQGAAVGRPVIAGRSGGAPEAVRDGETGLVVDPTSARAVAAALVELLTDRPRAARFGSLGSQWIQREWTWDHMATRLRALLRDALADSPRPARPC
jgi:phosphatidylinositol alpha-1,6-mannosyltransferase